MRSRFHELQEKKRSPYCCNFDLITPYPFSDALDCLRDLFWDRRRPRLPDVTLAGLSGDECRRGRLRSQKSAPHNSRVATEVNLNRNIADDVCRVQNTYQASSPARRHVKLALVATSAGEDACGPRRARPIIRR